LWGALLEIQGVDLRRGAQARWSGVVRRSQRGHPCGQRDVPTTGQGQPSGCSPGRVLRMGQGKRGGEPGWFSVLRAGRRSGAQSAFSADSRKTSPMSRSRRRSGGACPGRGRSEVWPWTERLAQAGGWWPRSGRRHGLVGGVAGAPCGTRVDGLRGGGAGGVRVEGWVMVSGVACPCGRRGRPRPARGVCGPRPPGPSAGECRRPGGGVGPRGIGLKVRGCTGKSGRSLLWAQSVARRWLTVTKW
jgi:hypothetical protein